MTLKVKFLPKMAYYSLGCMLTSCIGWIGLALAQDAATNTSVKPGDVALDQIAEMSIGSANIFERSIQSGPVVFAVLLTLVCLSIAAWAVVVSKIIYLRKIDKCNHAFIKSFWDSRSLNDLNSRLQEYPYSPAKEVFRTAYAELVRGSQLKDHSVFPEWAIQAAIENLIRALQKAKGVERRHLERFLSILAITASVSPFIGLFGTVWGIMSSFESIAQTGSSSLAAVAPGISEALIATAFGLAAAIPAVIGYNLANNKIRGLLSHIDGFGADFLNIVQRYLVSDKAKPSAAQAANHQMSASSAPSAPRL